MKQMIFYNLTIYDGNIDLYKAIEKYNTRWFKFNWSYTYKRCCNEAAHENAQRQPTTFLSR
jgi:hypothetical protein